METTTIGERGQVVIPKRARELLRLRKGERFAVLAEDDTVILRKITPPSKEEVKRLLNKARKRAEGLDERDVEEAISRVRSSTRTSS